MIVGMRSELKHLTLGLTIQEWIWQVGANKLIKWSLLLIGLYGWTNSLNTEHRRLFCVAGGVELAIRALADLSAVQTG